MQKGIICLLAVLFTLSPLKAQTVFREGETLAEKNQRMQWWRDAKFGMFIHWGLYAGAEGSWEGTSYPNMRPGIEWLMCKGGAGPGEGGIDMEQYVNILGPRMTLSNFEPETWAKQAKDAGMKYVVITAKHHDGFGMVDFPGTDWDIAGRSAYGKDPMLQLADALRSEGLKFGFYFSQSQDWSKPGGRPSWFKGLPGEWTNYAKEHAAPQLRHLLGGSYGTIDLLWFDSGSMTKTKEGASAIWEELAAQPQLIVNNRLKQGFKGDFTTPEQWIPPTIEDAMDWETCMTLNGSWGYNPTDPHWKTSDELIRNLCAVVGRGGNYLLNVGPKADGTWEDQVGVLLEEIGKWMDVNNEAVYGTHANPFGPQRWGEITWKQINDQYLLYFMLTHWPETNRIHFPFQNEPTEVTWLGESDSKMKIEKDDGGQYLTLNPEDAPSSAVPVLCIVLETAPTASPRIIYPELNGSIQCLPEEAENQGDVRIHWRVPLLAGWSGKNHSLGSAQWQIRVPKDGVYSLALETAFNHPDSNVVEGKAFVLEVGNETRKINLELSGLTPDPHNPERKDLATLQIEIPKTIQLTEGVHTLLVKAEGAPAAQESFTRQQMKKGKFDSFAYLGKITLTPQP